MVVSWKKKGLEKNDYHAKSPAPAVHRTGLIQAEEWKEDYAKR